MISRCQIFTDSLNPSPLEMLAIRLQGAAYRPETMQLQTQQLKGEFPELLNELSQLETWLVSSVS